MYENLTIAEKNNILKSAKEKYLNNKVTNSETEEKFLVTDVNVNDSETDIMIYMNSLVSNITYRENLSLVDKKFVVEEM